MKTHEKETKTENELQRGRGGGGGGHDKYDDCDENCFDNNDDNDNDDCVTLKQCASSDSSNSHNNSRIIQVGMAIMPDPLFNDPEYARVVENECNAVVIEHHLKWGPLCGEHSAQKGGMQLGVYDFSLVDKMVDWALQRNILVKGHVLVWAVSTPPILATLSPAQVKAHTRQHIFTVMQHFTGRIHMWDVVNEPLAPDGRIAANVFYNAWKNDDHDDVDADADADADHPNINGNGSDYIAQCFQWAHEADPTATLFLNENKVEGHYDLHEDEDYMNRNRKSDAFYTLVEDLVVNRQVPIHGIGLQAHFNAAGRGLNRPPSPAAVFRQVQRLQALQGIRHVHLSELDVRVSQFFSHDADDVEEKNDHDENEESTSISNTVHMLQQQQQQQQVRAITAQCAIYHDLVRAALRALRCNGLYVWGVSDKHSWVHHFYPPPSTGTGGRSHHDDLVQDTPTLLDARYQRKPCYYAFRNAIREAILNHQLPPASTRTTTTTSPPFTLPSLSTRWGQEWMMRRRRNEMTTTTMDGLRSDEGNDDHKDGEGGDARPDWQID